MGFRSFNKSAFYTDKVSIRGGVPARRHIAAALECCVFDCGLEDAFSEDDSGTGIHKMEILYPIAVWPFPEPPQIGDIVEIDTDTAYAVASVTKRLGDWCLTVRQSKAKEVDA